MLSTIYSEINHDSADLIDITTSNTQLTSSINLFETTSTAKYNSQTFDDDSTTESPVFYSIPTQIQTTAVQHKTETTVTSTIMSLNSNVASISINGNFFKILTSNVHKLYRLI